MAKGFKVKAAKPAVAPKDDFDIEKVKQHLQGKKIVFCIHGRGCSYTFLKNFHNFVLTLGVWRCNTDITRYSSMVNFARCKCLGANVLRGKDQKPWDGKLEYDYQLWIDNDIVFNTESFFRLMHLGMDKDIAAGWYATEDGTTTAIAHWLEEEDFKANKGVMNHETGRDNE